MALVAVGTLAGCTATSTKTADVSDNIRTALDKAGYKDVSVSQDRDKGVVTLNGHVAADGDKAQAESIAKSIAGSQVVSNEIAVIPLGAGSDAKTVNADLDKGIESNLDAALIKYGCAREFVESGILRGLRGFAKDDELGVGDGDSQKSFTPRASPRRCHGTATGRCGSSGDCAVARPRVRRNDPDLS